MGGFFNQESKLFPRMSKEKGNPGASQYEGQRSGDIPLWSERYNFYTGEEVLAPDGYYYRCVADHVSTTSFAADVLSGYWMYFAGAIATVTGARNGTSLSGTFVELGGNPLIHNTALDLAGFSLNFGTAGVPIARFLQRELYRSSSTISLDWENMLLKDNSANNSIDWDSRQLLTVAGAISIDWQNRELTSAAGEGTRIYSFKNSVGDFDMFYGTSNPEGTITASIGDLFVRDNGGNGELYLKETGTSTNTLWSRILTSTSYSNYGWSLTGNTGTTAGTNFIGTTDPVDFVIKTNSSEVARFSAAGNLGLGVLPLYRYHVKAATSMTGVVMSYFQNSANTAYMAVYDDGNCYLNSPQYTGWALQVAGTNVTQIVTTSSVNAKQRIPADYTFNRVTDDFCLFGQSSGNWFFQEPNAVIFTPSARVHIQGKDATITNYALKIENSIGEHLLFVRNDGDVEMKGFAIKQLASTTVEFQPLTGVKKVLDAEVVNTTDATVTTGATINTDIDSEGIITFRVISKKTSGIGVGVIGGTNVYIRNIRYKNVGGVVTIGAILASMTSEEIAAFNITVSISGTSILCNVIGAVNDNVRWTIHKENNKRY
jgi:hypothetical protein